jgi:hypothetical protein
VTNEFEDQAQEAFDQLVSSQQNFNNLIEQNPTIAKHPIYVIARTQLDRAVRLLSHSKEETQ